VEQNLPSIESLAGATELSNLDILTDRGSDSSCHTQGSDGLVGAVSHAAATVPLP